MKRILLSVGVLLLSMSTVKAQTKTDTPKVVVITMDGLRWQELFSGADVKLVENKKYVDNPKRLKTEFWRENPNERRATLMPFVWGQVAKMGQIHGNRNLGSYVNLTNNMWFSYPGYNEILTGKADDEHITSNEKINNPNVTFLERLQNTSAYNGKIAAFGSWDVFPYIINEERSGIPVNAGFKTAKGDSLSQKELFLNELQPEVPSPWDSVRLDAFTAGYAVEYMKREHPEVVYVAFGETDDFAHDGEYDSYLKAARNTDGLIKKLYDFTQQDDFYKDNTVFIISTDHGRGEKPVDDWRNHGRKINGADQVWMIVFGQGVEALGEVSSEERLFTNQIAPTVLEILNKTELGDGMEGKALKLQLKS
ncbi:alkaline phosphatase family protein [Mangrovimonas xylaniphaga]|uniref:alkaline phosphatase family protein n=1 Tax=Mangrovimonas xylaniphaga TaxID=1645915 RepID=UPI0006B4AB88|nr:alkaline phosphatase family protein [Mangrovimonas xylaniphaga]